MPRASAIVRSRKTFTATALLGAVACLVSCTRSDDVVDQPEKIEPKLSRSRDTTEPLTKPIFVDVAAPSGVDFEYQSLAEGDYFFPEIMGGGIALFDFDRDGDLDIYFTNGSRVQEDGRPIQDGESPRNQLFEQTAPMKFSNVTESSGLGDTGYGQGVAIGDVNNDGYPDVLVTNYGPDRLYLNNGDGSFKDITVDAGINSVGWGTSAAFVDFDRDGWLDLYIANYVDYHPIRCTQLTGTNQDYCAPHLFKGTVDRLFRNTTGDDRKQSLLNRQDGERLNPPLDLDRSRVTFEDVTQASGIGTQASPGLGVVPADFDADGWIDLYVANDQAPNFLWMNQRDGTFKNEAVVRGAATGSNARPQASMGVVCADWNYDGLPDIFLTHLQGEHNAFYLSTGLGLDDRAVESGLGGPSLAMTGFGAAAFDVEHDGDLDILVANGAVRRAGNDPALAFKQDFESDDRRAVLSRFWKPYEERNQLLLNRSTDDRRPSFAEVSSKDDDLIGHANVSRGMAVGDLDNDGDLDVVISHIDRPAQVLRNDADKVGNWLQLRLTNAEQRVDLGARVTIFAGDKQWTGFVNRASSYLSSNDARVHFGLGKVERIEKVHVVWSRGGAREEFAGMRTNQLVTLTRGDGKQ